MIHDRQNVRFIRVGHFDKSVGIGGSGKLFIQLAIDVTEVLQIAEAVRADRHSLIRQINICFIRRNIEAVIGGIALTVGRDDGIVNGRFGIVVSEAARNRRFAFVIQIGAVVSHFRIEKLLHRIDVIVRLDFFAVFPLRILVELNFKNKAGIRGFRGFPILKGSFIFSQIVLMRFGDVLDGGRHFVNPLIYSVF